MIHIVYVPFCSQHQRPIYPDTRGCCPDCHTPMELRVAFCGNASCRIVVIPSEAGLHATCGRPVTYRTLTQHRRSPGFSPPTGIPARRRWLARVFPWRQRSAAI